MENTFLYTANASYTYRQFWEAAELLQSNLNKNSTNNRHVVVLSSDPELYYLAFYFCFNYDYVYCPINIDDTFDIIETKISIIQPAVIVANNNFYFSRFRESYGCMIKMATGVFRDFYLLFPEEGKAGCSDAETRYVLFTSGTTGTQKLVPIAKSNVNCLINNMNEAVVINKEDVIANTFKFSFDLSVLVMIMAMTNNAGVLHITGDEILSGSKNTTYPLVTVMPMLPSVLRILKRNNALSYLSVEKVKYLLFCGEPLYVSDVEYLRKKFSSSTVINLYGPTELTIYCSWYKVGVPLLSYDGIVSIGRLNNGCRAYIRDAEISEDGSLSGELCVSGEQNFKGYINVPNSSKFIEEDGIRYYKTGDKVKYDGKMDVYYCLHRVDREIKNYGHRINLSYVENVFNEMGDIQDCAAVYSKKHMCFALFVISRAENRAEHAYACDRIPSYMQPKHFFEALSFPVNANFKKDYSALEFFYNYYLDRKHGS